MANIRRRGDKWQAQVRRKGASPVTRSFILKADAQRWARDMECLADAQAFPSDPRDLDRHSVADLVCRYRDEVVSLKKSVSVETAILNGFLKAKVADLSLSELRSHHFATYRDMRLKKVKPATIHRELGLLQHMFGIAIREWGVGMASNPLGNVRKPAVNNRRDRRLSPDEEVRLLEAASQSRNDYLTPLIIVALESAMRLGEILRIRNEDIRRDTRTLLIPETKNGHPRTIPLSRKALSILILRTRHGRSQPFPHTTNAVKLSWRRAVQRAGIEDLHFHDLRHEAISRFFELGLSVPEVALISGHRDPRMLFRYTHLKAESIVDRLP